MNRYPKEYLEYLHQFHTVRDYFECHEIGEEYWKEKTVGEEKRGWLCLIQLAVSMYHWRRENWNGAYKMMKSAVQNLKQSHRILHDFGIYTLLLQILLERVEQDIYEKKTYYPLYFPLKKEVEQIYKNLKKTDEKNNIEEKELYLIHKHKLRNRESVIEEREKSLKQKRQIRNNDEKTD